jgi:group I intron endonuclease
MATTSCIYRILNIENKKFYIGSAADYGRRKKQHIWYLTNGKNSPILQKSFDKYGISSFVFEIVEIVEDKNDLLIREQFYLDNLKPWDPKIGYNICKFAGNWLGNSHSEETKKILKDKATGYVHTKESRIKMSKSSPKLSGEDHPMYGKKHTEESKQKMKESSMRISGESHSQYGKKWESEYLEIFSEKSTGKNNPMHGISLIDKWKEKYGEEEASKMWILSNRKRSKMIIQKNKNGDFIEEFISMTEASLRTGINISLISKSCKGEKIKAGGYNWEYKELNNN